MFRVVTFGLFRSALVAWVALSALPATVVAQGAIAAFDLQTGCLVGSIPNAQRLSVTWTGACLSGSANGVGEVIAFSNGRLRYILRGDFRGGQLRTQENVRDCGTANCADDVPVSLVRLHEQAFAKLASSAPPPVAAPGLPATTAVVPSAVTAPAPASLTVPREIRAPDAVYTGAFVQDQATGVISGDGEIRFFDGRFYKGSLKNSRKLGTGTYVWADGLRYVGSWVNDLQQGRGTMAFVNGDSYEGDFVLGERTGNGTYRQNSGNTYVGQWLRGQRDGSGIEEWTDGQRYEGSWKANRKEGLGQMRFPDGGTYDGHWRDDLATGQGDIVFASGDVYTGQVRNGVPNGNGIFRWGSGDRFEGEFDAGRPTAKGEMTFMINAAAASLPAETPALAAAIPPLNAAATRATANVPSRANLCAAAFNAASTAVALRRFMDSFPDDECSRHALAKQKIAATAERERLASRATDEKAALAKTLIGAVVAFQQEFPFCVTGSGATCQRVTYVFDVKAKIRDIDVQKRTARVQISDATSLGNQKRSPAQLFAEGRTAATQDYKSRNIGVIQSKSLEEVGLAF